MGRPLLAALLEGGACLGLLFTLGGGPGVLVAAGLGAAVSGPASDGVI